jgi:hypothetical protein
MLTQFYVQELFYYDTITGYLYWKNNIHGKDLKNKQAGYLSSKDNYIRIGINNKLYLAHRLIWLYVYGEYPKNKIDHINGIKDDNRIENLRNVTTRENQQNRKEHRNGKLVGAYYWAKRKKWRSCITINGRQIYLGLYNTEMEAHEAYINKEKVLCQK